MVSAYSSLVVKDENTRLVEGFANVEVLDRQSDIVPTETMFKAMLGYMERGGIILLGHENKPVGKVVQWGVERLPSGVEGIHIIASIHTGTGLGDAAWAMLKDKQITGFSIGGVATETSRFKDKSAAGGIARELSEIELNEISLVQIPANPLAVVEQMSMAKEMDEDGRVLDFVEKEMHKYAATKREADEVAQRIQHEGNVVRRIYQVKPEGAESWCIDWTYKVNPSNAQGKREEVHPKPSKGDAHPAKIDEHKVPKQRVLMALKAAGLMVKSERDLLSVLPLIVDVEGKPEEEKAEDAPEGMKLEVDPKTSYNSTMYTGTPKAGGMDNCECEGKCGCHTSKDAVNSASPGAAHAVYSPMQKPVRSKAQWGWLGANRPDLLHRWQEEAPRQRSKLPEHAPKKALGTEKGGDDKRPNEDIVDPDQHDNDSEKVHGPDAFDRTDPLVDEKYHGDGTFVDARVVDIKHDVTNAKPASQGIGMGPTPGMPKQGKPPGPGGLEALKQCEICEEASMFKTHDDHEVCAMCAGMHAKSPYPFTPKEARVPNDDSVGTGGGSPAIDGEQVTASADSDPMKKPGPEGNEKRETAARHAKMKKLLVAIGKENIPSSQNASGGAKQGEQHVNSMQPFENMERNRQKVRKLLIDVEKKRKATMVIL
jgi:hypothetical protein